MGPLCEPPCLQRHPCTSPPVLIEVVESACGDGGEEKYVLESVWRDESAVEA